ncbi:MAG: hypothetical protein ACI4F9_07745 [Lachnospiraceae bacterium]
MEEKYLEFDSDVDLIELEMVHRVSKRQAKTIVEIEMEGEYENETL